MFVCSNCSKACGAAHFPVPQDAHCSVDGYWSFQKWVLLIWCWTWEKTSQCLRQQESLLQITEGDSLQLQTLLVETPLSPTCLKRGFFNPASESRCHPEVQERAMSILHSQISELLLQCMQVSASFDLRDALYASVTAWKDIKGCYPMSKALARTMLMKNLLKEEELEGWTMKKCSWIF